MIVQPQLLKKNLFPHQLKAVYELECREKNQNICTKFSSIYANIGIYSDLAGYGKTITMIALILRNQMQFDTDEPFLYEHITQIYGNGSIIKKQISHYQRLNSTLILAGPSIIRQWYKEVSYSPLNVIIINNKKKSEQIDPQTYDVIICSPTMFNHFVSRFPNYIWKRFIYDEPTHTKISGMRKIVAAFHWLITATPDLLLCNHWNSSHYLGSIFAGYFDYNLFKHLIVKNDDDYVKQSYQLPIINHQYYNCHDTISSLLKNIIPEHIQQMISGGNMDGAIRALGGTSSNNIFDVIQTEKQNLIQEANLRILRYERMNDQDRVRKWNEKKKIIQDQLIQLSNRLQSICETDDCYICLSKPMNGVITKCCYHLYCGECILKWLQNNTSCPLCRHHINMSFLIYLQQQGDEQKLCDPAQQHSPKLLSKIDMIRSIYNRSDNGRFIIFSAYDETLNHLKSHFDDILEIKGKMETREKIIDNFKTMDSKPILFINSIENGAGLNLQEATDIILYHEMSENMEIQVIGRCQRIGRTRPLTVHHLCL